MLNTFIDVFSNRLHNGYCPLSPRKYIYLPLSCYLKLFLPTIPNISTTTTTTSNNNNNSNTTTTTTKTNTKMAPFGAKFTIPTAPPSAASASASTSSSPRHINQALNALASIKNKSESVYFAVEWAIDPFGSIQGIHMFTRWLEDHQIRKYLCSDLLLVAWAIQGLPAGLRSFLVWSLANLEPEVEDKKINLDYLTWQLEMWRSVFSSTKAVEYARKNGGTVKYIIDWYGGSMGHKEQVQAQARRYWDRFSGMKGTLLPLHLPLGDNYFSPTFFC